MALILASKSPRRRELLKNAGIDFEVQPGTVEEVPLPGEKPEDYVRRVARDKALKVANSVDAGSIVLGADTIVSIDGEILEKPDGPVGAAQMLRKLSGRTHAVITGICIVRAPEHIEAWTQETTLVTFRALDEDEIQNYVASGEPFDKAGGYAIQGLASKFVTRIEGCYFNVVGLPVPRVYEIVKALVHGKESCGGKLEPRS